MYDAVSSYLPHRAPMIVLDQVLEVADEQAICESYVGKEGVLKNFLNKDNELPSWYLIELMAQTIGVWNGYHARHRREKPQLAFLLGARNLSSTLANIPMGTKLVIYAKLLLRDQSIGSFNCEVHQDGSKISEGRLTVYEPSTDEAKRMFNY